MTTQPPRDSHISMAPEILIFGALSDPSRLDLLFALRGTQRKAGDLAEQLDIPPSTLSFHLNILTRAGLIQCHKRGRQRWYQLASPVRRRRDNLLITTPEVRVTLQGGSHV